MAVKLESGVFFGRSEISREIAGIRFVECAYTEIPRVHLPWHMHENSYFYLVVEGACEESLGTTTRVVDSSALVFHPAGEVHRNLWGEKGGRVFHVEFSLSRIGVIGDYATVRSDPTEIRCCYANWLATRLYQEFRKPDECSSLVMEGLSLEILAEISRYGTPNLSSSKPGWLLCARDLLHDRFSEALELSELAKTIGVHPVHFSRTFHRHFGCTPGEYVRKLRIEAACRQLASSDESLIVIALSVGFADQSHFSKTFRRSMKMTPGEFRRKFRTR